MITRLAALLLAGLLLPLQPAGSQTADEETSEPTRPSGISVKLSTNDPLGVFFADDFASGKTPVTVSVEITNESAGPLKIGSRWMLVNHSGERVRSQTLKRADLEPKAVDKWFVTFRSETDLQKQGYYRFVLHTSGDKQDGDWSISFIIIPRPQPGLRPGSRFGVSVSALEPRAYALLQRIGARWLHTDSACAWSAVEPERKGEYRWDAFDRLVADCKAHDLLLFPSLAYAPSWAAATAPDGKPFQKRDAPQKVEDYADYVSAVVSRYKQDLRCFEVWSDPEVMGWTWHSTAQQYRDLLKAAYAAAKAADPKVAVVASGATGSHLRDVVFAKGAEASASLDQTSFRVFGVGAPEEDFLAKSEYAALLSRAHGKTEVWNTQAGWPLWDAPQLAEYVPRAYVTGALAGLRGICWSSLADPETGLFDGTFQPRPAAAAYAVCAQMLDGAALVEDLFPYSRTLWGALMKSPEGRKVAVLWTTSDRGTFTLEKAGEVAAFDLMGNPVGRKRGSRFEVPLSGSVVYLVSEGDQLQFLTALRQGQVREVTPVTARVLPLTAEITAAPVLQVVVTNQINRNFSGEIRLDPPPGWKLADRKVEFGPIAPGQSMTLSFPATTATVSTDNQYPVSFTIWPRDRGWLSSAWKLEKSQMLTVAATPRGTPTIDGDLADWQGVLPLTLNRAEFLSPFVPEALRKQWTPGNLSATIYTRWDDDSFYLAAEVHDNLHTQASFAANAYALPFEGDSLQIAFGSEAEQAGRLKPADAPNTNRGLLLDTDYEFALSLTPGGPELFQLQTPVTEHQTYYPTNPEIGLGLVPDARLVVKRDDLKEITTYECALPWSLLKGLNPRKLRLSLRLNDRDGEARGAGLELAAGLGVGQGNILTFSPTWRYTLANLTPWTLLGGR